MSKMNKDIVPEGFSLGLAVYDAFPVIFFGISVVLLGILLKSKLFVIGAILCFWAGFAKVLWKIIVVKQKKNIWWLFMQMRICMPIGFIMMIIGGIMNHDPVLWNQVISFPSNLFFLIGIVGMTLMGVAAKKLDSSDVKSNWIEQTINTIAQLSILIGVITLFK